MESGMNGSDDANLTVFLWNLNNDALNFGVRLKTVLAEFATDARLFETSERRLSLEHVVSVNPKKNKKSFPTLTGQ